MYVETASLAYFVCALPPGKFQILIAPALLPLDSEATGTNLTEDFLAVKKLVRQESIFKGFPGSTERDNQTVLSISREVLYSC